MSFSSESRKPIRGFMDSGPVPSGRPGMTGGGGGGKADTILFDRHSGARAKAREPGIQNPLRWLWIPAVSFGTSPEWKKKKKKKKKKRSGCWCGGQSPPWTRGSGRYFPLLRSCNRHKGGDPCARLRSRHFCSAPHLPLPTTWSRRSAASMSAAAPRRSPGCPQRTWCSAPARRRSRSTRTASSRSSRCTSNT